MQLPSSCIAKHFKLFSMVPVWTVLFTLLLDCCKLGSGNPGVEEPGRDILRRSLTLEAIKTGVWMNRGQAWPRCGALHYQKLQCSNFSLTQAPVDKKSLWQPDCDFLMRRLLCAVYQTNCPIDGQPSFQVTSPITYCYLKSFYFTVAVER